MLILVDGRLSTLSSRSRHAKAALQRMHIYGIKRCVLRYWITSSARSSSDCGIVMPRALAVFRLITS